MLVRTTWTIELGKFGRQIGKISTDRMVADRKTCLLIEKFLSFIIRLSRVVVRRTTDSIEQVNNVESFDWREFEWVSAGGFRTMATVGVGGELKHWSSLRPKWRCTICSTSFTIHVVLRRKTTTSARLIVKSSLIPLDISAATLANST